MPQINHLRKTPGELAEQANRDASLALGVDTDEYSTKIVRDIRDNGISLSSECARNRKLLKAIIDNLLTAEQKAALGDVLAEFNEYNTIAEEAIAKAKEQQQEPYNNDEPAEKAE